MSTLSDNLKIQHNVISYSNHAIHQILSSVQLLIHFRLFVTPWTAAAQASLSITNSQGLLKLMIRSHD